ncbi:sensor histidine kinase [Chitinophagaceae bacterium MMS25-I14]
MKPGTIRTILVLALLGTAGIIISQVYWLRHARKLLAHDFNLNVQQALSNTLRAVETSQISAPEKIVATAKCKGEYELHLEKYAPGQAIEHELVKALADQHVTVSFDYALYNGHDGQKFYQGSFSTQQSPPGTFPVTIQRSAAPYVFLVHFSGKGHYILAGMSMWILSTALTACILILLGYLLMVICKQRRLSDIQKDFVSNMTHEFKTPLSTIKLSAEVLKNPDITHSPQRLLSYATIISRESTHLTTQVERVFEIAGGGEDTLNLQHEPIDWPSLLKESVKNFEEILKEKKGNIILHIYDCQIIFNGDKLHLKNVISNLIDNAIKYCDNTPVIHIFLKIKRKELLISVQDNGIGIDKQHQKMLFERFYRVPTGDVHNVKGFGLGLSYVRIIAQAHGGDVRCTSRIGKGSTFTLIFPIKIMTNGRTKSENLISGR